MKKVFSLLYLACLVSQTFAQESRMQFMNKNGIQVALKKQADYVRIINFPHDEEIFYTVYEYYMNKALKLKGRSSTLNPIKFEGKVSYYDSTKTLLKEANFAEGVPQGETIHYYANGKVRKVLNYGTERGMTEIIDYKRSVKYKVTSYFDSTGLQILSEGAGNVKEFDTEKGLAEEGNYVSGLKDGKWRGYYVKTRNSFEEDYKEGEFISGIAKLSDGSVNHYTKESEMPTFNGGTKNFLNYIATSHVYTREAIENRVNGKIIVTFIVDTDGSLKDITIVKDLGFGTAQATIRAVRASPKWIPGHQHGIPVRVAFTLPITLRPMN